MVVIGIIKAEIIFSVTPLELAKVYAKPLMIFVSQDYSSPSFTNQGRKLFNWTNTVNKEIKKYYASISSLKKFPYEKPPRLKEIFHEATIDTCIIYISWLNVSSDKKNCFLI